MFCPECGKEITDDSKFCNNCGNRIESETKKETTPVNNDRPSPNNVTSQKKPESPLLKIIKNPVMVVLIIIICVSLLYFTFSSGGSGSNKLTSPVETVVQTPPVKTVETPKQDVPNDGWEELITYYYGVHFCKKKGNIEKDGNNIVQVWEKIVWSDKGREERIDNMKNLIHTWTEKDDKTLYTLSLVEIDCKEWGIRTLSINDYDKDGNVTNDYVNRGNDLTWYPLDEDGKLLRLKFCK